MTDKLKLVAMRGWNAYHEGIGSTSACAIGNDRGDVVAMAVTRGDGWDVPSAAPMARRVVACWNACAGIPTKQLENDFAKGYQPWGDVQNLREQRDQLLAALQDLLDLAVGHDLPCSDTERIAAREAIAKALGTEWSQQQPSSHG